MQRTLGVGPGSAALVAAWLSAAACVAQEPPDSSRADRGPTVPVRATTPCVIQRIVDGDTFECRGGARVRLIGMDAPERNQGRPGTESARALTDLIPPGSTAMLERDVDARDRYDRVLAHVWVDSLLVNWAMVHGGWAVLYTVPPNVQYVDHLTEAQRSAVEAKRGLWAGGGFECTPADRRRGRC